MPMDLDKLVTEFLEIKSLDEEGTFEGYGSVFGNVDEGKDVCVKGCFGRSLSEHQKSSTMPAMYWMHDKKLPIGEWQEMVEDEKGLRVKGKLWINSGIPEAERAYKMLKSNGPKGLSIGFKTKKATYDQKKGVRNIEDTDLYEVSVVGHGMNKKAQVFAVKDESAVESEQNALDSLGLIHDLIRQEMASTAAVQKLDAIRLEFKYNPNRDEQGRFAEGGSGDRTGGASSGSTGSGKHAPFREAYVKRYANYPEDKVWVEKLTQVSEAADAASAVAKTAEQHREAAKKHGEAARMATSRYEPVMAMAHRGARNEHLDAAAAISGRGPTAEQMYGRGGIEDRARERAKDRRRFKSEQNALEFKYNPNRDEQGRFAEGGSGDRTGSTSESRIADKVGAAASTGGSASSKTITEHREALHKASANVSHLHKEAMYEAEKESSFAEKRNWKGDHAAASKKVLGAAQYVENRAGGKKAVHLRAIAEYHNDVETGRIKPDSAMVKDLYVLSRTDPFGDSGVDLNTFRKVEEDARVRTKFVPKK